MTDQTVPRVVRPVDEAGLPDTEIGRFRDWLVANRDLKVDSYDDLHNWSVTDLPGFWGAAWDFFDVGPRDPAEPVLASSAMPGAAWFPTARVNYAEHALRQAPTAADDVAIIAYSQTRSRTELTWSNLADQVARARSGLLRLGVRRGDRVVAYAPNVPETVVAFLATASLGAVWAACAPEFGAQSVIDRFAQLEPTVMVAIAGYTYGDKPVDRRDEVRAIRAGLPTLRAVVHIAYGDNTLDDTITWAELVSTPGEPGFDPVPFDHPLCVLFSSGTTGVPKAIVHSQGGILLEHLKNHALSWDLKAGDRMLWFSTTAWMMWNSLVSGLLVGATIVLIDGNPVYPDLEWQWRLAAETRTTLMGVSPGYLMACRHQGINPGTDHDLSSIRQLGAAGSPLPEEGYDWVHDTLGAQVLLNVGSGGTDVCTGIVQGSPWQPVYAGEIAGRCLGVAAAAYDEHGFAVPPGELGELVITAPMPSMPIAFWGDPDGSRLAQTYFDTYPGIWKHGDWIRFSPAGSCVIAGRSDATLNRGGVRLGTGEFYRVVEEMPGIDDSLVVHLEDRDGGNGELILFVQLTAGVTLDPERIAAIRSNLRSTLSPRHAPDTVVAVPAIPRNRTGKKLEVPVKKVLQGANLDEVASRDVLADSTSMDAFVELARARGAR